ncbi:hypothetical protein [Methylorubrum sp. POS3]|uniref:hypothetical protein n=1 Tax=Methylorubrum sp. POS3 TaxID=2998492 RepID=UPI00372D6922
MVIGLVLSIDRAPRADLVDNDPIRLDGEDRAPIADPQAVAFRPAFQRFDVFGERGWVVGELTELAADQFLAIAGIRLKTRAAARVKTTLLPKPASRRYRPLQAIG